MTGFRSRNGTLMRGPLGRVNGVSAVSSCAGCWSSEITPFATGWVVDGQGRLAELDVALEVAQVEVEERAVRRGAADLGQLHREHLERAVDLCLVAVEVAGDAAQLLDVGGEARPDAGDQVGGLHGEPGDGVQGPEDRLPVLAEPRDELAQLDQQGGQLLVAVADG